MLARTTISAQHRRHDVAGCYVTINRATGATTFTGAVAVPSLTVNGLQRLPLHRALQQHQDHRFLGYGAPASADGLVMVDASGNAKYFSGLSAASVSTACSTALELHGHRNRRDEPLAECGRLGRQPALRASMTANAARRRRPCRPATPSIDVLAQSASTHLDTLSAPTAGQPGTSSTSRREQRTSRRLLVRASEIHPRRSLWRRLFGPVPPTASEIDLVAMNHGSKAYCRAKYEFRRLARHRRTRRQSLLASRVVCRRQREASFSNHRTSISRRFDRIHLLRRLERRSDGVDANPARDPAGHGANAKACWP